MRSKPDIAIVIPLYNKERYIKTAIESIHAQTLENWECIIVNDGSTDRSLEIAEKYVSDRVMVHTQRNAGPGAARNTGVELVSAEVVTFLDADDSWDPNYLHEQYKVFQDHPKATVSTFGHIRSNIGKADGRFLIIKAGLKPNIWDLSPEEIKIHTDFMHSGSTAVKTATFKQYGGFYTKNRCTYGEDSYLWFQLLLAEPVHFDPKPLMVYNIEGSELGVRRTQPYPCWPKLIDNERIFSATPKKYHNILNDVLAYYAIIYATRSYQSGKRSDAIKILKKYANWKTLKCRGSIIAAKRMRQARLLYFKSKIKKIFRP